MKSRSSFVVAIDLSAAIVSVADDEPSVLAVRRVNDREDGLPFGPFDPANHRTLESGLRTWVQEQTRIDLAYAEQLYTFGDRGRHLVPRGEGVRIVSVGYLALARQRAAPTSPDSMWRDWYRYFPWEDWRKQPPEILAGLILPALNRFVHSAPDAATQEKRRDRVRLCFGTGGLSWDEEKVLERYELLYEAGLVAEAERDGRARVAKAEAPGVSMMFDHRRILATAIARLRGKMKYRPVVFELMAPSFTLLELQRTVEAISGIRLHKQNFRRLVEDQGLVEGTGKFAAAARGRPAELFRFRRDVMRERPSPGLRLGGRARAVLV
ncbi:MAG: NAD regulator [Alphaproteobacteria bacterium]|nr:NAD regulator [Alphaproteobacteria bacterium]